MTAVTPHSRRLPWVVAAVLGVVAIALAGVLLFVLHPQRSEREKQAAATGLTALDQQAMDAAAKQIVNLQTYSRKTFAADYARVQAGATGDLAKDLSDSTRKSTLQSQMTQGAFDLQGQVTNVAFEQSAGGKWLILVSALGYRVPDKGTRTLTSNSRFEVAMVHDGGKWLASSLRAVGLV